MDGVVVVAVVVLSPKQHYIHNNISYISNEPLVYWCVGKKKLIVNSVVLLL